MNADKEKVALFIVQVFFRQEMNIMKTEENERLGIRARKPLIGVTMKYLKARANIHRVTLWRSLKGLEASGLLVLDGKTWLPSEAMRKTLRGMINDVREWSEIV